MITTHRFRACVSKAVAKVKCVDCGKVRTRTFKTECYSNGLHNLQTTMRENQAAMDKAAAKLKRSKFHCGCKES